MSKEKIAAHVIGAAASLVVASRMYLSNLKNKTPEQSEKQQHFLIFNNKGVGLFENAKIISENNNLRFTADIVVLDKKAVLENGFNGNAKNQHYPFHILTWQDNKQVLLKNAWFVKFEQVKIDEELIFLQNVELEAEEIIKIK